MYCIRALNMGYQYVEVRVDRPHVDEMADIYRPRFYKYWLVKGGRERAECSRYYLKMDLDAHKGFGRGRQEDIDDPASVFHRLPGGYCVASSFSDKVYSRYALEHGYKVTSQFRNSISDEFLAYKDLEADDVLAEYHRIVITPESSIGAFTGARVCGDDKGSGGLLREFTDIFRIGL